MGDQTDGRGVRSDAWAPARAARQRQVAERVRWFASLRRRRYSITECAQLMRVSRRTCERYNARLRGRQGGA